METTNNTHRTHAAFLISGRWVWKTWYSAHASKHAAIVSKAEELGAKGFDCGQADHDEIGRGFGGSQW